MNKRILTLFLSLTLLLSLAACGGNADTTDARRDANEIVVGIAQDLENSLDPYTSVTAANREVLFNVIEGLVKPDADGTLTIAPTPDKSLGWAKAAYDSPVGRIVSCWRYDGDAVTYEFEIPANLTADVTLPDGRKLTLAPGKHIV